MVKRFVSFVLVVIAFMSYSTVGQTATYQKGDVNKDGAINITDVTLIQMYMAGESIKNFTLYNADFNGDGSITINDISTIQLYMCGHISLYNNYFYTLANGKATITGYNGSTKKLNIPSYLYSDKNVAFRVTTIGENAFYKKYFITEVIIPESVIKIEDNAFANCKNLATVTIINPNCHIDSSSFENCPISSFKFG